MINLGYPNEVNTKRYLPHLRADKVKDYEKRLCGLTEDFKASNDLDLALVRPTIRLMPSESLACDCSNSDTCTLRSMSDLSVWDLKFLLNLYDSKIR